MDSWEWLNLFSWGTFWHGFCGPLKMEDEVLHVPWHHKGKFLTWMNPGRGSRELEHFVRDQDFEFVQTFGRPQQKSLKDHSKIVRILACKLTRAVESLWVLFELSKTSRNIPLSLISILLSCSPLLNWSRLPVFISHYSRDYVPILFRWHLLIHIHFTFRVRRIFFFDPCTHK